MNAIGVQRDVETILHEAGHAFHALATRDEDLYAYRSAPIEFCEVASMGMELLGYRYIEEFYPGNPAKTSGKRTGGARSEPASDPAGSNDAKRARRAHLEGIVTVFPWIATVDAFQHWVYTHPEPARAERIVAWLKLMNRFGGEVDWSGCEAARARSWHRQLHIFLLPFYYIEYGFAELGALQIWANSKTDGPRALDDYKKALKLGGSRPLPELFAAAGCKFDFSDLTFRPLMRVLREELEKLSG
jgi:oligoendopeptidase F